METKQLIKNHNIKTKQKKTSTSTLPSKTIILNEMKYAKSIFQIAKGLMFANKEKIEKGICLVIPKESIKGASVTMFFCFHDMDILFLNNKFEIVEKTTLKKWKANYTPKYKTKYIIESTKNKFKNLKIGDKLKIN